MAVPFEYYNEILLPFGESVKGKQLKMGYLEWMVNNFSESLSCQKTAASEALIARAEKVIYNVHILLTDLKSCSIRRDLQWGRKIHAKAVESRYDSDKYVGKALVRMYAKCRSMVDARRVFDSIQKPDVVCWNILILGYAENGEELTALELFSKMNGCGGCVPDSVTFVAALKACAYLSVNRNARKADWLKKGRDIHLRIGFRMNLYVQNTLVDMYAKYGCMMEARNVFDSIHTPDVVSWTTLLRGYAENGEGLTTLELFTRMKARGCQPDSVTYAVALKACTSLAGKPDCDGACLKWGREIHSEIGHHLDHHVQSTLVDMYAKCNSMGDSHRVFDSIRKPDVVCWNALLLGYAENGEELQVLKLFSRMKKSECVPDSVTYVAALKACCLIGALVLGRKFHSEITDFTPHLVTCLVDFYAKCGSMVEACRVFDFHSKARIVSTWNALLAGYGSFGETCSVFENFDVMQDEGFEPDAVTFVCMLSCCSHAGLIEKAREYFEAMPVQYGVTPRVMHYTCMVDLLGRANKLNDAIDVLRRMPCNPDAVIWMTLLGACRKWKNVEIGRCAFQSLIELDKKNAAAYILMANIYGSRGMWEEQESVLKTRIDISGGACKLSGVAYSIDEVGNVVKFVVGEEDTPDVKYKLEQLAESMIECGYNDMSRNVEKWDECGHNERRAVVYGILKTPLNEPIRAFKNIRMCDECHVFIKMISKLAQRVIMVRDVSSYHVMVNGMCSCGDYW